MNIHTGNDAHLFPARRVRAGSIKLGRKRTPMRLYACSFGLCVAALPWATAATSPHVLSTSPHVLSPNDAAAAPPVKNDGTPPAIPAPIAPAPPQCDMLGGGGGYTRGGWKSEARNVSAADFGTYTKSSKWQSACAGKRPGLLDWVWRPDNGCTFLPGGHHGELCLFIDVYICAPKTRVGELVTDRPRPYMRVTRHVPANHKHAGKDLPSPPAVLGVSNDALEGAASALGATLWVGDSLLRQFHLAWAHSSAALDGASQFSESYLLVNAYSLSPMSPAELQCADTAHPAAAATAEPPYCPPLQKNNASKYGGFQHLLDTVRWTERLAGIDTLVLQSGHHWHKEGRYVL